MQDETETRPSDEPTNQELADLFFFGPQVYQEIKTIRPLSFTYGYPIFDDGYRLPLLESTATRIKDCIGGDNHLQEVFDQYVEWYYAGDSRLDSGDFCRTLIYELLLDTPNPLQIIRSHKKCKSRLTFDGLDHFTLIYGNKTKPIEIFERYVQMRIYDEVLNQQYPDEIDTRFTEMRDLLVETAGITLIDKLPIVIHMIWSSGATYSLPDAFVARTNLVTMELKKRVLNCGIDIYAIEKLLRRATIFRAITKGINAQIPKQWHFFQRATKTFENIFLLKEFANKE